MAVEDSGSSVIPSAQISRDQFDALLASHKAFHEVAIKVTSILQDPSRFASYQSIPSSAEDNLDETNTTIGQAISGDVCRSPPPKPLESELSRVNTFPPRSFDTNNAKARKDYYNKRQRSIKLFAQASTSYVAAEYDFQCKDYAMDVLHESVVTYVSIDKFYPDDLYQQLDHQPQALDFDPLSWASKPRSYADLDAYNAYHQLDHGRRLQQMVFQRGAELMEALFPLRTSTVMQSMSWPELEYSYGLHLKDIINRLGFAKCDNAIGFMDSDITSVVIEIGRFFTDLDSSNRPKDFYAGKFPDAVGPFMGGCWSDATRSAFTLNELHRRCCERGLLKDWEGNKVLRIVFNAVSGTGIIERQAEYLYILEAIFAINRSRRRNWPLRRPISKSEGEMFILDFLEEFSVPESEESLEQAIDHLFAAHDLNIKTLGSIGGLRIIWTDCTDDHLRLSTASRTITLFWDVSLLDQSLLFWYNARSLKQFEYSAGPGITRNSKSHLVYELKNTYRLIFYNQDAKQFTNTETCAVKKANKKAGIVVHDLRVDVNSSRARKILKHLLEAPLPEKIARDDTSVTKPQRIRHIWWPIGQTLEAILNFTHRKQPPSTISTHLASGPPYCLDLCWHLENILTPYPGLAGESEKMRSFAHFPRFGPRLREIKFYMDNQKPSGWYQMWKDKRDRVQYVTFWAVLIFGTASIALALISVAVSSAQTVAAFRSMNGGGGG